MREKVRDLIYLDTERYTSLDNLRVFYWGIIILPFFMVLIGIISIKMIGVCWRSLFPIVSIAVWSVLYWIFVLTIQSKKTKKTFELRFLVNGICGVFLSSLWWIFAASFSFPTDTPLFEPDFLLLILPFYLLFTVIYIAAIILGVHKGIYGKIREKGRSRTFLMISAYAGAILPGMGSVGMNMSRLMRAHASERAQTIAVTIGIVLLIFLPAIAHINFVQYYYCKKYGITCDEDGNETSPKLERKPKVPKRRARKIKKVKKKLPLAVRILIGIVCTCAAIFLALFIIGFIRSI